MNKEISRLSHYGLRFPRTQREAGWTGNGNWGNAEWNPSRFWMLVTGIGYLALILGIILSVCVLFN